MSLSNLTQVDSAVASEEGALMDSPERERKDCIDNSHASIYMCLFTNQGHFLVLVSEKILVV